MFVKIQKGRTSLLLLCLVMIVFAQLLNYSVMDFGSWVGGFMVALVFSQLLQASRQREAERSALRAQ